MLYKQKILEEIKNAINKLSDSNQLQPSLERTKQKEHGDVATNIAMVLAKELRKNPIEIAKEIKEKIKSKEDLITHIEIAKPGFINLFVGDYALVESLVEVLNLGKNFGLASKNSKEKILIEYVSANPTGDLHLGHGRQAVIGSTLINLLRADGFNVKSEFYINDFGEQIEKLSETAWTVNKKLKGENIEWKDDLYPEENISSYVKEVVQTNKEITKENLYNAVKELILKTQKELLFKCKVTFDKWFSETSLHKNNQTNEVLNKLKETNYVYESEGATWFKAKEFGDPRDRVLIRSDGRPTYLLTDIAYHVDKLKRSERLVTVWGADHHGQEVGLKGGLKVLGYDDSKLEIIFVQLVSLKKEGKEVKMSKRAGEVVTIEQVINEVGVDAFRYFLAESHPNNRMVFDIDLAKKQDKDNPVYYIQYAHARCCSIFRQLDQNLEIKKDNKLFMNLFKVNNQEYEATKNLILRILDFPEEVTLGATSRALNRITNYLKDLSTDFHHFYTVCRVMSKDTELTKARLGLVEATKITISNGLKILDISAPETM